MEAVHGLEAVLGVWQAWLWSAVVLAGAGLLALGAHHLFYTRIVTPFRRTSTTVDSIVYHTAQPVRVILPLLGVLLVLPSVQLSEELARLLKHVIDLGLIASVAWLLLRLTAVVGDLVLARYDGVDGDDLAARQVRTRVQVLRRIAAVTFTVVTLALMLMTFPSIQHLGVSLLASAGFAGLVAGIAARPALGNLIAGLQIALTQPIRLNDVVIVEGEWGWIEEIGTTYVVVRVWDLRRLVIPLSHFIEKPFQNWTQKSADILGTVYLYTDFSVPVDEIRAELHRVLERSGMWDGKVWGLQVTNATDRAMELRALMSAPNSGRAWDLRCHVREQLIAFLQRRYPESLPRVRAELARDDAPSRGESGGMVRPDHAELVHSGGRG